MPVLIKFHYSRCLNGMLNGNIGVIKSMLAELTDDTNMARGFSLIPVIWALGGTIGFGDIAYFVFGWLTDDALVSQAPHRWRFVTATGPLAQRLLSSFLGRIPVLPAMCRDGHLYPHILYFDCVVFERGWSSLSSLVACAVVLTACLHRQSPPPP